MRALLSGLVLTRYRRIYLFTKISPLYESPGHRPAGPWPKSNVEFLLPALAAVMAAEFGGMGQGFGFVEGGVGPGDQFKHLVVGLGAALRDADGKGNAICFVPALLFEGVFVAGKGLGPGALAQDQELVAAVAVPQSVRIQRLQDPACFLQDLVPDGVAVTVVEFLEIVNIDHIRRNRRPVDPPDVFLQRQAVPKAGQGVPAGSLFQPLV